MKCKHCGCELLTKDGIVKNKQRWKCKNVIRQPEKMMPDINTAWRND